MEKQRRFLRTCLPIEAQCNLWFPFFIVNGKSVWKELSLIKAWSNRRYSLCTLIINDINFLFQLLQHLLCLDLTCLFISRATLRSIVPRRRKMQNSRHILRIASTTKWSSVKTRRLQFDHWPLTLRLNQCPPFCAKTTVTKNVSLYPSQALWTAQGGKGGFIPREGRRSDT